MTCCQYSYCTVIDRDTFSRSWHHGFRSLLHVLLLLSVHSAGEDAAEGTLWKGPVCKRWCRVATCELRLHDYGMKKSFLLEIRSRFTDQTLQGIDMSQPYFPYKCSEIARTDQFHIVDGRCSIFGRGLGTNETIAG